DDSVEQRDEEPARYQRQPAPLLRLFLSQPVDHAGAGCGYRIRPERRRHAHGADAVDRSDHEAVSAGNQGAPERVAPQRVLLVGTGEHRLYRPRPVDARHRCRLDGGRLVAMTMRKEPVMHTQSERGIALVLALFLMTALSVLGASLMFLSQTETYASMNYRMMSQ